MELRSDGPGPSWLAGAPAADLAGLAVLADPTRLALYEHLAASDEAMTRDELAVRTGLNRQAVRFNLDRLVAEGLLEVEYRRPEGRTGPGAGRTAKYYRRCDREFSVTVPARRYDLAARVLADAVGRAIREDIPVLGALREEALARGTTLGGEALAAVQEQSGGRQKSVVALRRALDSQGYDTRVDGGTVSLGNCPFAGVLGEDTYVICTLSKDLIDGIVAGCHVAGVQTTFGGHSGPDDRTCCVRIEPTPATG